MRGFGDVASAEKQDAIARFKGAEHSRRDIGEREVLAACAQQAGLSPQEFAAALSSGRYHEEVPKALQQCIEARVFGVPIFLINGKRFWGNDRLDFAIAELERA